MKNLTAAGLGALVGAGLTLSVTLFSGRRESRATEEIFSRPIVGPTSMEAASPKATLSTREPVAESPAAHTSSPQRWAEPNTFHPPSINPVSTIAPLSPSDRSFREAQGSYVSIPASNGRVADLASRPSPVAAAGAEPPLLAAISVKPSAIPGGPLDIEIGPGVLEPMAAIDSGEDTTPAQASALKSIVDDFAKGVQKAAADQTSDEKLPAAWDAQKEQADSLYRILFGDAAFNQMNMEASIRSQADSP